MFLLYKTHPSTFTFVLVVVEDLKLFWTLLTDALFVFVLLFRLIRVK
jgi:hypothetical protein